MTEKHRDHWLHAAVLTAAVAADALAGVPSGAFHYLVGEIDRNGQIRVTSHRLVELSSETGTNRPAGGEEALTVSVMDRDGRELYLQATGVSRWLRAELPLVPAPGAPLTGLRVPLESVPFVVRAPAIEGSTLRLGLGSAEWVWGADREGLATLQSAAPAPAGVRGYTLGAQGAADNRVDIVIVGEGYTRAEEAKFLADAERVSQELLRVSPFAEYRNFFNVSALFVASPQSGADHPPYQAGCATSDLTCCSDSAALNDPRIGTYVSTAFDGRYCTNGIHRLLTVDSGKVMQAAAAVPAWDRLLVLVNDPVYGGSGGFVPVASTNPASVEVARHEFGHSFVGLADEYEGAYPGYPPCSDRGGAPCEANVTDETGRSLLKWRDWVDAATPLPTPPAPPYLDLVGLFEGARYQPAGMYRPRFNCLMRSLGVPFCEVCRQEALVRLYRGGWGTPSEGIALIEPDSASPPAGTVTVSCDAPLALRITPLQAVGAAPVEIRWSVNGEVIRGATAASFTLSAPLPRPLAVEVEVRDASPFVRGAAGIDEGRTTVQWQVNRPPPRRRLGSGH